VVAAAAAAGTASASAALLSRRHLATIDCDVGGGCPAASAAAAAAAPERRGATSSQGASGVHSPSKPRRAADAARPLVEGSDFTVFRRAGDVSSPLGPEGPTPAAHSATLSEALEAIASSRWDGAEGEAGTPWVVLLGEVHDDVVAHRLQLQVLKHCAEICQTQGRRLVLSLEMFESDVQRVLDEYVLDGAIREQDMLQDARPWSNYADDYRPMVEFCKAATAAGGLAGGLRVVAANAPRRYVSLVARGGSAALDRLLEGASDAAAARALVPPLPLPPPSAAYRQKFEETLSSQMPPPDQASGSCPYIGFSSQAVREGRPEMLEAQLLWDHSMAQSIASALREGGAEGQADEGPPPLVLHICGAFHCAHGLGIPEALPLYGGFAGFSSTGGQRRPAAPGSTSAAAAAEPPLWLPMDELVGGAGADAGAAGASGASAGASAGGGGNMRPKRCPPGVLSIVCWPASVAMTLEMVKDGVVPRALGDMGDFVIITEETYGE